MVELRHSLGGAWGHIKAFECSPSPHQSKLCNNSLQGQHYCASHMLKRILIWYTMSQVELIQYTYIVRMFSQDKETVKGSQGSS